MIDLKRFCETVFGNRYPLQTPWLHGGFAHATNGHIYIRVPCDEYGKYPDGTIKNAFTAQKIFSDFIGTGIKIKASEFKRETQLCRDCAGVGTVTDDGLENFTCDWCMGTGVHFAPMMVRERYGISSVYVEMCKWLPNCTIEESTEDGKPYKICFDGGEGFVAPIDSKARGVKGVIP